MNWRRIGLEGERACVIGMSGFSDGGVCWKDDADTSLVEALSPASVYRLLCLFGIHLSASVRDGWRSVSFESSTLFALDGVFPVAVLNDVCQT